MKDDSKHPDTNQQPSLSRREFTALTVAAGVSAAASGRAFAAGAEVTDTDVQIKTADGTCDAALVHPSGKGAWPGVIIFPDIWGLRPTMRDMAKRLAVEGYTVLVPNPFYRSARPPVLGPNFDFGSPEDRARLGELRKPLTQEAVMRDGAAWVAFLDAQDAVNKKAKIGVVGYCMGGPMTMQAAAAAPDRIGAGASFHGGGLVTDKPDSPHLLVPKMKARYYFGVAANDDERQPDAKTRLDEAFRAAQAHGEDRGLPRHAARLVREGHARAGRQADLQRGGGGEGVGGARQSV